ncbi:patatin-like phospholipase family protein [Caballeronia sp. S22]|uniref:patatin-like phospholipase family protein n=1 Tax=Caballeronia sp. S22 TaxID=3137182 RepID=UPI00353178CE
MPKPTVEAKVDADAPQGSVDLEAAFVKLRRDASGEDDAAESRMTYGLALSGGGIRSATFALGVMRGLAKQGSLHLFDYLSTVSGGGYVGVAFGRLFSEKAKGLQVESCLADDRSMFLWWLRHNGRYLIPAGAKDEWLAAAAAIRGWISSQFSFLLLVFAAVGLVCVPHAIVWTWPDWGVSSACTQWLPSVWLIVAVLPAMLTAICMWAYYLLAQRWWAIGAWMAIAILVLVSPWNSFMSAEMSKPWCLNSARGFAWGAASFVAASEIAGSLYLAWWTWGRPILFDDDRRACDDPNGIALKRLGLTAALRGMLLLLVLALLAALLDSTSWWLFAKSTIED